MNQGENAPPMHPRCRCTIVAHMEGTGRGERVAGRTRISADVSYRQWLMRFDLQRFGGQRIPAGDYNLAVRRQVQNRHIEGTREYAEYINRLSEKHLMPSKLVTDINPKEIIREFHGKGIYDPNFRDNSPRERVDTGRVIGQYWDTDRNQFVDTSWLMIVYSKRGTHIYPIRPQQEE